MFYVFYLYDNFPGYFTHWNNYSFIIIIINIIYLLTARVVGASQRWFPPFFFAGLHCPLGLGELQACPFPDVVFLPLPLSASSSSPGPRGLTFTWWGCCTFCFQHKLTELARFFLFCSCVCFCHYGPFNCFHSINFPDKSLYSQLFNLIFFMWNVLSFVKGITRR